MRWNRPTNVIFMLTTLLWLVTDSIRSCHQSETNFMMFQFDDTVRVPVLPVPLMNSDTPVIPEDFMGPYGQGTSTP